MTHILIGTLREGDSRTCCVIDNIRAIDVSADDFRRLYRTRHKIKVQRRMKPTHSNSPHHVGTAGSDICRQNIRRMALDS